MKYKIINGDVMDVLQGFEPEYFSAAMCDPPYHLTSKTDVNRGFMGHAWDGGCIAFQKETWEGVKNVLIPGAFLMAFGGMRTYHRLVSGIEDSGMIIRDAIAWIYADSRPPSTDISKSIDKSKGFKRKVVGKYRPPEMTSDWNLKNAKDKRTVNTFASSRNNLDITAPESQEAQMFDGYGTALKPACELVSLSMKPLIGNFVDNALRVGVSGLNINSARLPVEDKTSLGRWPKNVLLDEEASNILNDQFQGANRFFYCNKASTKERNEGLPDGFLNKHPTIKPISLTTYLARLCLPPPRLDGQPRRILIPFAGVGSECIGAIAAGFDEVVGIEKDLEYVEIARARLDWWHSKMQ